MQKLTLFLLISSLLFALAYGYPQNHPTRPIRPSAADIAKCPHLSSVHIDDPDIPEWHPTPKNPLAGRAPFLINETTNYYEYHAHNSSGGAYKRSSCPALNALANRGYLPRSGKDITIMQFVRTIRMVYNFAEDNAFIVVLPAFAVNNMPSSINLDAFNAPNVQHVTNFPTSPCRSDIELGDNINLNRTLYKSFLSFSSDGETWTVEEMARHHHLRHNQSLALNPKFRFGNRDAFGTLAQYANLLAVLGRPGKHGPLTLHVSDVNTFMLKEDLPKDYMRRELPYYNVEASAYIDRMSAHIGFTIMRPLPEGDGTGKWKDVEPTQALGEKPCRKCRKGYAEEL
ncbi:Chloroperoxidase [Geopyxis carbonaria]|nr:Chloroperoxidase [Geopyxis carbonaria]